MRLILNHMQHQLLSVTNLGTLKRITWCHLTLWHYYCDHILYVVDVIPVTGSAYSWILAANTCSHIIWRVQMIIRHPGYGWRLSMYWRISRSRAESVECWIPIWSRVLYGTFNQRPMSHHLDSKPFNADMMFSRVNAGVVGKENKHDIAVLTHVSTMSLSHVCHPLMWQSMTAGGYRIHWRGRGS